MKRILSVGLIICLLAALCGCGGAATSSPRTDVRPQPDIYPTKAGVYFSGQQITEAPAVVYTTTAEENGLDGTIYTVTGQVSSIEVDDSGEAYIWIFIDTSFGTVIVANGLNYILSLSGDEIDPEKCTTYFTLPEVGDYVCIYSEYLGFSEEYNCAAFIYGGTEYVTDVLVDCWIGETDETATQPDASEPDTTGSDSSEPDTTQPDTSSDTSETGGGEPAMTMGQKNALNSAKQYLSFSAFSYQGLIEQLEYEEYSTEDATFAADNCGADWNEQALKSAKTYLNYTAFSYSGLIDQLEYEGFTTEQATYAVDNCGADWNEQAAKSAESYLKYSSFSRDSLIDQLEYEGFTHEQAVYGVEANGY